MVMNSSFLPPVGLLTGALLLVSLAATTAYTAEQSCSESARLLRYACEFDTRGDQLEASASCLDETTTDEACLDVTETEFEEAAEECGEIFEARLSLCESLNDEVHEPPFGPSFATNFVDPRNIGNGITPNPYFPLVNGNQWVLEGTFLDDEGEEFTETVTVTVTNRVKRISGIDCVVVNDTVLEDGEAIEITDDWYAQDNDGNVWYCGESAQDFETFDGDTPQEPELVEIEGSWKAGLDSAEAGILIPFEPVVGDVIRQEVLITEAEDVIEILSIDASESTPGGSCTDTCLQTRDFTPLEADANEHKYYAPGIGLILEVDLNSGERLELMQFTGVGS